MAIRIVNEQFEWRIAEDGKNLGFFERRTGSNYLLNGGALKLRLREERRMAS